MTLLAAACGLLVGRLAYAVAALIGRAAGG